MKKNLFKLLLLALLLVFFAACSGDKDGDDNGQADAGNQQQQGGNDGNESNGGGDTAQPALNEYGLPTELGGGRIHEARDFGGRTLTIGAWWDEPIGDIWWGDPPNREESSNYEIDMMRYENAQRVREVFNVNFDSVMIPHPEMMPMLTTGVLTGESLADVVFIDGNMQLTAIAGGLIQPWNSANLPNADLFNNRIFMQATTQDENNIWVINQNGVDTGAYGLVVNLDIINADGLDNPIDLYENGEWTWDAMLNIMRLATRSTDGSGVINQFGISGQPGLIIQCLIGANDGILVTPERTYGFEHPNTVRTLEFAYQIFDERLWSAEADGTMTSVWERNFSYGFTEGTAALFPGAVWSFDDFPPEFEYGFVPFPTGPNNTTGNTWLTGFRQGIAVPVSSNWEMDEILIILEELFSWPDDEPELLFEAGDIDWMREIFLTEADVQRAVYVGNTAASDVGINAGQYYWILGDFATEFWNNERSVMESIEYHRGPQQDILDEFFARRQ